uniref:Secreted protein n=1 Tax=Utricularia reniformis TaxID=192314 RepID=A0A1Y0B2M4_9LAMI|nr:hypothetical protein AEK19_MT1459 [Utricularia reniformis]ART31650.1 hypothetical protein AEK19_MT1459 [Utricularia reniformis]
MNNSTLWLLLFVCAEQELGLRQVKPLRDSSESEEIWNSKPINRSLCSQSEFKDFLVRQMLYRTTLLALH